MICQRCGHCCLMCSVVVVVNGRAKLKPSGIVCPNLTIADDGTTSCKVHDEPWYKYTPCFSHGNPDIDPDYAANPSRPCAIGVCCRSKENWVTTLRKAQSVDEELEDLGPYPEK
jgi:hypothetical protein